MGEGRETLVQAAGSGEDVDDLECHSGPFIMAPFGCWAQGTPVTRFVRNAACGPADGYDRRVSDVDGGLGGFGYYFERRGKGVVSGSNDLKANYFGDDSPETSLVRELIQNSLDAADPEAADGPVTVVYEMRDFELDRLPGVERLREAAGAALKANSKSTADNQGTAGLKAAADALAKSTIAVLRIGDYGTKGLLGDENDFETPSSLAVLTRSDGMSDGNSDRGGSFGIGSASARMAADTRAVAWISKPRDAEQTVYASMAHYASWTDSDSEHTNRQPTGIFTKLDVPGDDVVYPRGIAALDGFPERTENGTDVYVLGCSVFEDDPGLQRIRRAAVENFMVAIHTGRLVVRGVKGDLEWVLDAESLRGVIEHDEYLRENVRPFYLAVTEGEVFEDTVPALGTVRLHVYTGSDVDANLGTQAMRKPLMKVQVFKTQVPLAYAAVFICEDDKGNERLREIEPPKHDKWNSAGTRGNASLVRVVRDFIRRTLRSLVQEQEVEEIHFEGLNELLPAQLGPLGRLGPEIGSDGVSAGDPSSDEAGDVTGMPVADGDAQFRRIGPASTIVFKKGTATHDGDEEGSTGRRNGNKPKKPEPKRGGRRAKVIAGDGQSRIPASALRFRSYTDASGVTTVVIHPKEDVCGDLPVFALGSGSNEVLEADLQAARLIRAGGKAIDLEVQKNVLAGVTFEKGVATRLQLEFENGQRYRLGVGDA